MTDQHIVPDSEYRGLVARLPDGLRGYALLARFDRPIGWWLLFWPCLFGLWLAGGALYWGLALAFLGGAVAMRGAGCVYNDIVDRDLDARVARTASRPLPAGMVSLRAAWIWLILLCLVGLLVLLQLNRMAQIVALGSILLVAAYPFMKRITWWPQAWLGLVFSWGVPVGWTAAGGQMGVTMALLYAGTIFWVIGYDTIYAMQDREDDALVGIRSSALRLGARLRTGVLLFYMLALAFWAGAIWSVRPQLLALAAMLPVTLHLLWQVASLKDDGADALVKFRSNRTAGLLMAAACLVVGNS